MNPDSIRQSEGVRREDYERLVQAGLACVSVNISVREDTGKKVSMFSGSWKNVVRETSMAHYDASMNSVAILTGNVSGLFVLDVDNSESEGRENGMEAWDLMVYRNGDPVTWTAKTGGNGLHVYFRMPASDALRNRKNRVSLWYDGKARGIDVRAEGGVAFCPPSSYVGPDSVTRSYSWVRSPFDTPLADVPDWLLEALEEDDDRRDRHKARCSTSACYDSDNEDGTEPTHTSATSEITELLRSHPKHPDPESTFRAKIADKGDLYSYRVHGPRTCLYGHRHNGRNNFAVRQVVRDLFYICHGSECSLKPRKKFGRLSLEAWLEKSPARAITFKDTSILSVMDTPCIVEAGFKGEVTHRSIARMLAEVYKRCGRIVSCDESFYVWCGDLWKKASASTMRGMCSEHVDYLGRAYLRHVSQGLKGDGDGEDARAKEDAKAREKERKAVLKGITKTGSFSFIDGVLKLLVPHVEHEDFAERLDKNKDIVCVKNGIVCLKTGEFFKHHPRFLCTFSANAEWRPGSKCTVFKDFMDDIFNGDSEVVDYLQLLLGYALTAHVSEQMFVIFHGAGANGKGVLLNALKGALGPYYAAMHKEVIVQGQKAARGAADPHMAALENSRYAVCDETGENDRLDDAVIKSITGESAVVTRNMYERTRSFYPTFQPMLATNHRPEINVADSAILRRLVLVPFVNTYVPCEKFDPELFPDRRPMDTGLNAKLSSPEARSEIIEWLVGGAVRWYRMRANSADKNGVEKPVLRAKPRLLDAAMTDYINEQDPIKTFVEEHCETGPELFASSQALLYRYREAMGDERMTAKALASGLKRLGFNNNNNKPTYDPALKHSVRGFKGLALQ